MFILASKSERADSINPGAIIVLVFPTFPPMLRESTIAAVTDLQNAIDGIPAAPAGGTDTGVTSADLDNLDAVLTEQAQAIRTKTGQTAPAPATEPAPAPATPPAP